MKNYNTILMLVLILSVQDLSAQVEEIINPSDLKQQTIITEPQTLRKGYFRTGAGAFFIMTDRLFDNEGNKSYALGTNAYSKTWTYFADLQYGITDWFQASITVPFSNNQYFVSGRLIHPGVDSDTTISYKVKGRGLSDVDAGLRLRILKEDEIKPSLTLGAYVTIPTGKKNPHNIKNDLEYDQPTGSGHYSLSFDLRLKKIVYPYSFTLYAFYFHNFEGEKQFFPDEDPIRFKNADHGGLSGALGIHLNDWIALINDVGFNKHGQSKYYYAVTETSDGGWTLEYQPAIYFQIRRFRLFEVVQIPLWGKNTGADPVYFLNIQYMF